MKFINICFSLIVGISIISLTSVTVKADTNDELTVVEMVSSDVLPGSSVVPVEIRVINNEREDLTDFMKTELEVWWNNGVKQKYEMTDDGYEGDKVAGDGIFTSLISTGASLGEHRARVNVGWKDSPLVYPVEFSFTTLQFPDLTLISDIDFVANEELSNVIGFLKTEVGDIPFEVRSDDLKVSISNLRGESEAVVIIPKNKPDQGLDYEFFIASESPLVESFQILASIDMEFLDISYVSPQQKVTIYKSVEQVGIGIVNLAGSMLLIIVAAVALYFGIMWHKQASPHGFVLDSKRNFIIDFNDLKRSFIKKILSKNKLSSRELESCGLNGVSLKFFGGYILVEVENNLGDTIRINSKPVTKSKVIESESSVGFHGKLFFINSNEKQLEFPVKGVPASELG